MLALNTLNYQQPDEIMANSGVPSAFNPDANIKPSELSYPKKLHQKHQAQPYEEDETTPRLTDLNIYIVDLKDALVHELREKAENRQRDKQAYRLRIEALCAEAEQDGYDLNADSERDFWQFIQFEPFIRKGNLVLMDNGNLRVVWRDNSGTHIGLQFLGGKAVQYVIFKHRASAGTISRVVGRDNFDGVKRQIQAFDLRHLVYA